ncbi:DNA internalization-related competence protein ComEC/Rec2 [Lolliginicoccus suaedae]|uniref:DNA internalization-related competence protein ComEC/Rec2 n=1 Tax=Lolliginicoccus suaedae TaxID=2605429 RepID=UPI0011F06E40|nr:DNA internalization-related competence protein ComEC/Rec2 [Lolliginicoccus suaedae]
MTTSRSDQPSIDIRLVPCALVAWAATALAVAHGHIAAIASIAVAATIALATLAIRPAPPRLRVIIATACLFWIALAAAGAMHAHAAATHPLRAHATSGDVVVQARVLSDPRLLDGPAQPTWLLRARLEAFTTGQDTAGQAMTFAGGTVTIFARAPDDATSSTIGNSTSAGGWATLLPGDHVRFTGTIAEPSRNDLTVATVFARGTPTVTASTNWWGQAAGHVRDRYRDAVAATLDEATAAVLPGIVIGDRSAMPPELREAFVTSSLTHLTVVSGTHVTIVCGAVLLAARIATGSRRAAAITAAVALLALVIVCRPEPSVLRAAAMGSVTLLAILAGRRRHALPALCAAVIVLLIALPQLAVHIGFALSVIATAGLVLLAPPVAEWLQRCGMPRRIAAVLAVALAAQIVTAPLIAAAFGQFSVVGVLANLLVAPIVTVVIVCGYLGLLLAPLSTTLAAIPIWIAGHPTSWIIAVATWCAGLPRSSIGVPQGASGFALVLALTLLGAAVLRARQCLAWWRCAPIPYRCMLVLATTIPACLVIMRVAWPPSVPPGWLVAACDVGQGDMFVVATGARSALVIDTGPEPAAADRCLDRLGIRTIDAVLITHLHADHVDGLEAIAARGPSTIIMGPGRDPEAALAEVDALAQEHHIPVRTVSAGDALAFGPLRATVLGPEPQRALHADPNDQSLVVSMTLREDGPTLLVTGDAEHSAQQWLLGTYPAEMLRADIMTVPHHGAATTDARFLAAVKPRIALIGVGADNSHGHPRATILDQLRRHGAVIARTDQNGTSTLRPTPEGLGIVAEHADVGMS